MGAIYDQATVLATVVRGLEAAYEASRKQFDDQELTITAMEAEIADLTAKLKDGAGSTPASPTLVGSSAQPGSLTSFEALEANVGKLGAWRIFVHGTQPGTNDIARIRSCLNGRRPIVSVSGGTDVAKAKADALAFARAVAPLKGAGSITFGHEPTQKFPGTMQEYVLAKNAYYQTIKTELPRWDCIDIFMAWDIKSGGARDPRLWRADLDLLDGVGVDAYDEAGKVTPAEMLAPALALAADWGKPLWVTETATIDELARPNYRPDWITEFARFARGESRIKGWTWFNSNIGPNAPPYGWFVTSSPASTAAFTAAVGAQ